MKRTWSVIAFVSIVKLAGIRVEEIVSGKWLTKSELKKDLLC